MKLENLNPLYHQFSVGDYKFKVTDFDDTTLDIDVLDAGDLRVGEFTVNYDDTGELEIVDSPDFPETSERLRKDGNSDEIVRHIKKTVQSVLS